VVAAEREHRVGRPIPPKVSRSVALFDHARMIFVDAPGERE
jgi:hypothetical protein